MERAPEYLSFSVTLGARLGSKAGEGVGVLGLLAAPGCGMGDELDEEHDCRAGSGTYSTEGQNAASWGLLQ
jgi:hypothetical protein